MGRLEGTGRWPLLGLCVLSIDDQGDTKELEKVVTESPALDAALAQASSRMQDAVGKGDGKGRSLPGGRRFLRSCAESLCRVQGKQALYPYVACVCVCMSWVWLSKWLSKKSGNS